MSRIQPMIHNWTRLILLFILLTNAVSCTGRKQSVKSSTATSLPTEISSDVDTSGPVVITFAGYEYERQLYEPLMAEFHQQNPDITVQFAALPQYTTQTQDVFADYPRLLATTADTTLASGFGPGSSTYFRDLTPLIESDPGYNPADFWPVASNACQDADGHVFGVPASVMVRGVYFDAKAFDEAGLPRPAPGWTWDDFRKDVETLAKSEGETIRYGYAERFGTILAPLIEAALVENNGVIVPETMQPVVQWYLDMVKAKAIRPTPDYSNMQGLDDWDALFKSTASPAMWSGNLGDTMPGNGFSTEMAYQEYGFTPYPAAADDSNRPSTPVWVACLSVSSGNQNLHAAWQWLDFLSRHWLVVDKTNAQAILTIPGRISVAQSEGYWQALPGEVQSAVKNILEHSGYANTQYADSVQRVTQALIKAAAEEKDFTTALQETSAQPSTAFSGSGTPIVVATPKPTFAADATVINFYFDTFAGGSGPVEALAEQYQKTHPGINIKVTSSYDYSSNKETADALNESFDCMAAPPIAYIKPFLPLDKFFDAEDVAFRQDFDPILLNALREDGVLRGLPAASQPSIMVYNADLLAKRGIQPPSLDWTFDTFVELLSQAASADKKDPSYGTVFNINDGFFFSGRGVVFVDFTTDPPTPKFDSPEVASALAWLDEMTRSGVLLPYTDESSISQISSSILSGKLAFWRTEMGHLSESGWWESGSTPPNYHIGILPVPAFENSPYIGYYPTYRYFISSQSRHAQACWDWIKFLTEQPTLFNGVPARQSVMDSAEWEAFVGKDYAKVLRWIVNRARQNPQALEHTNQTAEDIFIAYLSNPFSVWEQKIIMSMINGEDYTTLLAQAQTIAENYLACTSTIDYTKLDYRGMNAAVLKCAQQVDPGGGYWGP